MSRVVVAALVTASLAAAPARASTTFRTTWKAPDVSSLALDEGEKVLVMVMSVQEDSRDGIEALFVQDLGRRGIEAVPAYAVIPRSVVDDKDKARPYIEKTGARYALVMRVVGREKELTGSGPTYTAVPVYTGAYYSALYGGFYSFGWGMAYNAGNVQLDQIVHVETLVYDLSTDKLIWAGMSDTKNPDTAQKVTEDLVKEVGKEMKKQGLVRR